MNTIIDKLQDSFKLMLETTSIDNHQLSVDNLYVTGELAFLVILLDKWIFLLNGALNAS